MINYQDKKVLAWGASKLLEFYLQAEQDNQPFAYVVDSNNNRQGQYCGPLMILSPDKIIQEDPSQTIVVLFAISNLAIQEMLAFLNRLGYALNINVFLYSDLFYDGFARKFMQVVGQPTNPFNYQFVKSFCLNTKVPIHTTFLGNLMFLDLLSVVGKSISGVAEVGAYHGGNSLLGLLYLVQHQAQPPFYILDSFEGFPPLSRFDPLDKKPGDYNITGTFEFIRDSFSMFSNAYLIKGFVPESFAQLEPNGQYSLVFFDCDLYEPALATFEYFWPRLKPGGFLVVHDYFSESGGYTGVRRAVLEFFKNQPVVINEFWENTMALIIKP